jgi:hypothetical protein
MTQWGENDPRGVGRRSSKAAFFFASSRGTPVAHLSCAPTLDFLLRGAETQTLPGANPADEQVAVVRETETYLAAVAHGLAKRGTKGVVTGV